MLNLLSINPTGLFSFGKTDTVDLTDCGLVHLRGVNFDRSGCSNGAGKSSFFNSICEILWGQNPTGVKGKHAVNQSWLQGCAARVEFVSWENIRYRVTYCRNWKDPSYYESDADSGVEYAGTSVYFEKYDGGWFDLRTQSIADTRKLIVRALGLSYNQFLAVSHLSPRVGSEFLRGTNKERVSIVSDIAGLGRWDNALQNIRTERKVFDKNIAEIDQKTAYERGILNMRLQKKDEIDKQDWQKLLPQYEQQYAELVKRKERLEKELAGISSQIKTASNGISSKGYSNLNSLYEEIKALQNSVAHLYRDGNVQRQADEAYKAIMAPIEKEQTHSANVLAETKGELSSARKNLKLIEADKCPTCGTKISKTKKEKIERDVKKVENKLKKEEEKYEEIKKSMDLNRREADRERTKIIDKLKDQEDKIKIEISEKEKEYNTKKKEYDTQAAESKRAIVAYQQQYQSISSEASRASQEANTAQGWVETCKRYISERDGTLEAIKRQEEKIGDLEVERRGVEGECEIHDWLIKNIPYIKLHKLAVYMIKLSNRANEYLASMGDTIRISVDAFSEKANTKSAGDMADMLKSEINVLVTDGGKTIDSQLYSDGETSRITNALIRALHDLSVDSGRGCNLVFLDEVFSFVDDANAEKLSNSILPKEASTIILTDNSSRVENYVSVNQTWTCKKQEDITTIERS